MDNYSNSATSNLRRPVVIVLIIMLVLFIAALIAFFVFNALVFVDVANNSGNASISTTAVTSTKTASVGGVGLLIVPRDTKSLIITAGDYAKTQAPVNIPWIGFGTVSTQLNADLDADKIAFVATSPTCATYEPRVDALLNYNCQSPIALQQYQTPANGQWSNQNVAALSYISNQFLPPYLGGVLGVTGTTANNTTTLAITATSAGKKIAYDAPSGLTAQTAVGLRVFTDINDPTNSHFVLVDSHGAVYLATIQNGKATYKTVAAPGKYSFVYNQTYCSLSGETVYCFRGRTGLTVPTGATVGDSSIDQFSFSGGQVGSKTISAAPVLDSFYLTTAGKLYGKSGSALYSLTTSDNNYIAKQLPPLPDTAAAGDKLYFVQTNGVFALDDATGQSHQIFYSPNITVVGVFPVAGKLYILGSALNGGGVIYAYKLNTTSDTTPGKRLIDVLPLSSADASGIIAQDFVGDKVVVQQSSGTDATTVKNDFVASLKSRGIDLPQANLTTIK